MTDSRAAPLSVLIANIIMRGRSGTEVVVRDLALGLTRRGYRVAVCTTFIGESGRALARLGIDVVDDLRKLRFAPDVVHGHHNAPTLAALERYPRCAAFWTCHDWRWWYDAPPRLARIHRYIAIDRRRLDYLVGEVGIAATRTLLLRNALDLSRTPTRDTPLRESPARALAYTKTSAQIPVVREGCRRAGIDLATLGRGVGREVAEPERELVQYDLVFATGRHAIDALCAGCAVIVGDARGLVGLVTMQNYERLRDENFGPHRMARPMRVDALVAEMQGYDREDARRVCERMRRDADIEPWLDTLERLYREAIDAVADAKRNGEDAAIRRELRRLYPRMYTLMYKQRLRNAIERIMPARESREQ